MWVRITHSCSGRRQGTNINQVGKGKETQSICDGRLLKLQTDHHDPESLNSQHQKTEDVHRTALNGALDPGVLQAVSYSRKITMKFKK